MALEVASLKVDGTGGVLTCEPNRAADAPVPPDDRVALFARHMRSLHCDIGRFAFELSGTGTKEETVVGGHKERRGQAVNGTHGVIVRVVCVLRGHCSNHGSIWQGKTRVETGFF